MKLLTTLFLIIFAFHNPALSAVLSQGKISNGFYYQKIQRKDGSIQYLCRSTSTGKIQKHSSCDSAGAKKP